MGNSRSERPSDVFEISLRESLTLEGQGHFEPYLQPDSPAFAVVAATTTDFFRWSLSGDRGALNALRKHARVLGLAHLDDRL